jgi:hypothetical protein
MCLVLAFRCGFPAIDVTDSQRLLSPGWVPSVVVTGRVPARTGPGPGHAAHRPRRRRPADGAPEPDDAPRRGQGRGFLPDHQARRNRGLATVHEQHVRPVSVGRTAGHRGPAGVPRTRRPVGVHLRDPVLPAVPGRRRQLRPATTRRRLAEGMAAAGRVRLPRAPAAAGAPVPLLPAAGPVGRARSTRPAHPARRRRRPAPRPVPGRPQAAGPAGTPGPAGPGSTPQSGPEKIPWLQATCSPSRTGCSSCCGPRGQPPR